jgi:hypothetical protein
MKIAAWDWGTEIIGVLDFEKNDYQIFHKDEKKLAIHTLIKYDVLITFSGTGKDISETEKEHGTSLKDMGFSGIHIDMSDICYPNVLGSDCQDTFLKNLNEGHVIAKPGKILRGSVCLVGENDSKSDSDWKCEQHYINDNWFDCFKALSLFVSWMNERLDSEVYFSRVTPNDFNLKLTPALSNWKIV